MGRGKEMLTEKYLNSLTSIFSQEELDWIRKIASPVIEKDKDLAEDVIQSCIEALLKARNGNGMELYDAFEYSTKNDFSEESLESYKDNVVFSYKIEDVMENNLADEFIEKELPKAKRRLVKNRKRDQEIVSDFIEGMDESNLALKYKLSQERIKIIIKKEFRDIGRRYYYSYFDQFREQYDKAVKKRDSYYRMIFDKEETVTYIKSRLFEIDCVVATYFERTHLSEEQKLENYDTYQNVKEVEKKVYTKKAIRIG